jgi:hypothetical protein
VVAIILFGKSLAAFVLVLALRYPLNTAITVSASLAQIGEFSFILAALGMSLGLLPDLGQNLILAGAIISIAVNPLMFKAINPLQEWLRAKSDLARKLERSTDPLAELPMTVTHERLTGPGGAGRLRPRGQAHRRGADATGRALRGGGTEPRDGRELRGATSRRWPATRPIRRC